MVCVWCSVLGIVRMLHSLHNLCVRLKTLQCRVCVRHRTLHSWFVRRCGVIVGPDGQGAVRDQGKKVTTSIQAHKYINRGEKMQKQFNSPTIGSKSNLHGWSRMQFRMCLWRCELQESGYIAKPPTGRTCKIFCKHMISLFPVALIKTRSKSCRVHSRANI